MGRKVWMNGPAQCSTRVTPDSIASTAAGSSSAATRDARPSSAASTPTLPGFRPPRVGRRPRCTAIRAINRPVYPVAPYSSQRLSVVASPSAALIPALVVLPRGGHSWTRLLRRNRWGIMASPVIEARTELRILVVADDPLSRSGLAALLQNQAGCLVAGQIAGDADILAAFEQYRPDLKDYALPVAALLADESLAAEALAAGARGLLLRNIDPAILATALDGVSRGLAVVDPTLAGAVFPARARPPSAPVEDPTPRERSVLQWLAISEHTVKFHVNAILGKLGAHSRTEAVTRAARLGLLIL